jgi:hypothetical protein
MSFVRVTKEMVDAGVQVLMRASVETPLSYDEVARMVYKAMRLAKPKPQTTLSAPPSTTSGPRRTATARAAKGEPISMERGRGR